ncbi:MAG TPA: hypothetical protein VNH11_20355 [Pirellulales bacterium]|nr:hypothetical protein [Pirellulales bacterium]
MVLARVRPAALVARVVVRPGVLSPSGMMVGVVRRSTVVFRYRVGVLPVAVRSRVLRRTSVMMRRPSVVVRCVVRVMGMML